MELKEKVAIVTGGASGLGEACARRFALQGANIGILDVDEGKGGRLAAELGAQAIYCRTDVTSEQSVQAAVDRTVEEFARLAEDIVKNPMLNGETIRLDGAIRMAAK